MNILKQLIDLVYPPRCHICQAFLWGDRAKKDHDELPFCRICFDAFREIVSPLCPICGTPFDPLIQEDHICENCLRKRPFYSAIGAPYLYEGSIMSAIHQFKYMGKTQLAGSLGSLLGAYAGNWLDKDADLIMMPVPLHPKRLRERGFNQSLLLARSLSSILDVELDYLSLRRSRYTPPQTGLSSDDRRKNVRRAFEIIDMKAVKGRSIVLVDDVTTTGSTLNECARVLKRSGAEKIFCLVIARTGIILSVT